MMDVTALGSFIMSPAAADVDDEGGADGTLDERLVPRRLPGLAKLVPSVSELDRR